jgi:class I fructose-bisphosphate aldolase
MAINIQELLGDQAKDLLNHQCRTISKDLLHLPNPNFVDDIFNCSDRSKRVIENLKALFDHGRLSGTGYLSILPVDQGVEHSAGASFAPNPLYFDPENILKLAIEGGCNAVASTVGVLGMMAQNSFYR